MEDKNIVSVSEIFFQITELQRQLTENAQTSLHRLGDAITSIREEESEADGMEQISEVCDVFKQRELTILSMLDFYRKMYEDIQNEMPQKIELISKAFEKNAAFIEGSDMETQDKFAALTDITEKIAALVEKILKE